VKVSFVGFVVLVAISISFISPSSSPARGRNSSTTLNVSCAAQTISGYRTGLDGVLSCSMSTSSDDASESHLSLTPSGPILLLPNHLPLDFAHYAPLYHFPLFYRSTLHPILRSLAVQVRVRQGQARCVRSVPSVQSHTIAPSSPLLRALRYSGCCLVRDGFKQICRRQSGRWTQGCWCVVAQFPFSSPSLSHPPCLQHITFRIMLISLSSFLHLRRQRLEQPPRQRPECRQHRDV
jgi:hypothetical protein